jgi:hypothetical protein
MENLREIGIDGANWTQLFSSFSPKETAKNVMNARGKHDINS